MEVYGIVNLESDVMSYQKMFHGNQGEKNFFKLVSIFWGDRKESNKIRSLTEEIEQLDLRMDDVFAL